MGVGKTIEMVSEDSVLSIWPNVKWLSEYFLFHMTSDGVMRLDDTIVSSRPLYSKGTCILHGYYYDYIKYNQKGGIYKKVKDSASVLYVGTDFAWTDGENFIL